MHFRKYLHSENFEFPSVLDKKNRFSELRKPCAVAFPSLGNDIFRFTVTGNGWNRNESTLELFPGNSPGTAGILPASSPTASSSSPPPPSQGKDTVTPHLTHNPFTLSFQNPKGHPLLESVPGKAFGVCGDSFLMGFNLNGDTLRITTRTLDDGYDPLELNFVLYGSFKKVIVNRKKRTPKKMSYRLAGRIQNIYKI